MGTYACIHIYIHLSSNLSSLPLTSRPLSSFPLQCKGVKWSLVLGSGLLLGSRFVIAVTNSRKVCRRSSSLPLPSPLHLTPPVSPLQVMQFVLYTTLPMGSALGIPVMQIGIRRYTNKKNRAMAFSLFYMMMNIAAVCAAPAIDGFRGLFHSYQVTLLHIIPYHTIPYHIISPHIYRTISYRARRSTVWR